METRFFFNLLKLYSFGFIFELIQTKVRKLSINATSEKEKKIPSNENLYSRFTILTPRNKLCSVSNKKFSNQGYKYIAVYVIGYLHLLIAVSFTTDIIKHT